VEPMLYLKYALAMLLALILYLYGCARFAGWLLFSWWRIPRDRLARTLELDFAVMCSLPRRLREAYLDRQIRRRDLVEIREYKEAHSRQRALRKAEAAVS